MLDLSAQFMTIMIIVTEERRYKSNEVCLMIECEAERVSIVGSALGTRESHLCD